MVDQTANQSNGTFEGRIVRLISTVGFPAATAIALFAVFVGWLPSPVLTHALKADSHWKVTEDLAEEAKAQTRLLRVICRNIVRNEIAAAECDR